MGVAVAVTLLLTSTAQGICDDGNTIDGDCCSSVCAFEASGSPCTGTSLCRQSAECDGAGACVAVPRGCCHAALKSLLLEVEVGQH
jgi:cysteine-rich repeat protein